MEKLSSGLEIWRCPNCELRHVFMNYLDLVPEGFGFTQQGRTFEDTDGLPSHESRLDVTPQKDYFEQQASPKEGEFTIERWFKLHAPYHRRAGNAQKQKEERECIIQILPEFNKSHQSNLTNVTSDPDDASTICAFLSASLGPDHNTLV